VKTFIKALNSTFFYTLICLSQVTHNTATTHQHWEKSELGDVASVVHCTIIISHFSYKITHTHTHTHIQVHTSFKYWLYIISYFSVQEVDIEESQDVDIMLTMVQSTSVCLYTHQSTMVHLCVLQLGYTNIHTHSYLCAPLDNVVRK